MTPWLLHLLEGGLILIGGWQLADGDWPRPLAWTLLSAGLLLAFGETIIFGSGGCHVDWDGRANPTECD